MMDGYKTALVADWLDAYGGAERVIKSLNEVCGFDSSHLLICLMRPENLSKIYPEPGAQIHQTGIRRFGKHFRYFFFLFHRAIEQVEIPVETDLIVSSSHSVAKGVRKSSAGQLHVSYFQARNFNYVWEDADLFFGRLRPLFNPLINALRKIDVKQAQRPDFIVANSMFVRDWVKLRYGREAEVIYPPVDLTPFALETEKSDYYVAVGRIVTVKKFDIVVEAFNRSGKKLVVIGEGQHLAELKAKAAPNISFLGFLETAQLRHHIAKAKAFVQSGVEGFGIAVIEAQACGTPVIAFGKGGALETVEVGRTGIFFEEQTATSLEKAIQTFERQEFDAAYIRNHALQFSKERFNEAFKAFLDRKLEEKKGLRQS